MKHIKFGFAVLVLLAGILLVVRHGDQEVFIESLESKTRERGPVFNKIKFFSSKDKDIWMMNQSHHGATAEKNLWDRLAIVVDKRTSPKTARFFQFESGALEWKEDLNRKPFRVSCMCHNNGPRAIRPNMDSSLVPLSWGERIKIGWWNIRIKLYGRIQPDIIHDVEDRSEKIPFRHHGIHDNDILKVGTCVKCHKDEGLFARGFLHRQQSPTIHFMVESGQIPPPGFSLSPQEKSEIDQFLMGF
ncbi:MAG TPA: hypothetical protein VN132_01910 [Bdellovibrio sp.]|nr:hypothetical protein [Bdellovibrio sp.]